MLLRHKTVQILSSESAINCANDCQKLIEAAQSQMKLKKIGLNEKEKYLIDGIFKNENVNSEIV